MGLPKPADVPPPPASVDVTQNSISKDKQDTDSDDEYLDIDIKTNLKEFKKEHPGERFPIEMTNEAVRWRLN